MTGKKLEELLHDRNESIALAAAGALADLGSRPAIYRLVDALRDTSLTSAVRKQAIILLGTKANRDVIDDILKNLRYMEEEYYDTFIDVLSQWNEPGYLAARIARDWAPSAYTEDTPLRRMYAKILENIHSEGEKQSIELLQENEDKLREGAAIALRWCQTEQAEQALITALEDKSGNVVYAANQSLQEIGTAHCVLPMMNLLRRDNLFNAYAVCKILERINDPEVEELFKNSLLAALNQPGYNTLDVCSAMGTFKDQRFVEPLLKILLEHDDLDTRCVAARALVSIGDPRAIDAMIMVLIVLEHTKVRLPAYSVGLDKVISASVSISGSLARMVESEGILREHFQNFPNIHPELLDEVRVQWGQGRGTISR